MVPIFFARDPFQSDVERFLSKLPRSTYWGATTSEYGVGQLRVGTSIVVDEPLPATSAGTDIELWLARHLDHADPDWPSLDPSDIYVVFYPQDAFVTDAGNQACGRLDYHYEGFTGSARRAEEPDSGGLRSPADAGLAPLADAGRGTSFLFAVVSECRATPAADGIDAVTESLSHELIEASTDPFVVTDPAFLWVEGGQLAWSVLTDSDEGQARAAQSRVRLRRPRRRRRCAAADYSFVRQVKRASALRRSFATVKSTCAFAPAILANPHMVPCQT